MNWKTTDRYREPLFVVGVFVGMLVFALGIAFFILGVTVNTEPPPSPYMNFDDKVMLTIVSAVGVVVGAAIVRYSARIVGW